MSIVKKAVKSRTVVLLVIFALLAVYFNIRSKGVYLGWSNVRFILTTIMPAAYITIGAVFLMIMGNIDISASRVASLSGVVMAKLMIAGLPWYAAIFFTLVIAGGIGAFTSVLVNEFRIPTFVATMAMSYITMGATLLLCSGFTTDIENKTIKWLGTYKFGGEVPLTLVFTAVVFVVCGVVLARTKFGKSVYLSGGNPSAAKLSGLKPRRISYILFALNAALCAIAGMINAARMWGATSSGVGYGPFEGITCALIGGVAFGGGSGNMGGAFAGLLLINGFNNGLSILFVAPYWKNIASGFLLLLALMLDFFSARKRIFNYSQRGAVIK
ncbi:MAG: ABC transporter permease [Oscillospiraceae bacterium]|nr:ABC transporter permease [Oscillospiraceae bacterium]